MNKITKTAALNKIESRIENGIGAVGKGLLEINEKQLFKLTHETFNKYCQDRWGFRKSRAYQLIEAEKTKVRLSTIVEKVPAKESHLREIAKAPETEQAEIVAEVQEQCQAENREPTAKDYKQAVEQVTAVDDGANWLDEPVEKYEDVEPDDEPLAEIPAKLKPAYDLRLAWESTIKDIRKVKTAVSRFAKQRGGEWINESQTNVEFQNLINLLAGGMFGSVCRQCSGEGCDHCKATGYQPERFENE